MVDFKSTSMGVGSDIKFLFLSNIIHHNPLGGAKHEQEERGDKARRKTRTPSGS